MLGSIIVLLSLVIGVDRAPETSTRAIPAASDTAVDSILQKVDQYRGLPKSHAFDLEIRLLENGKVATANTYRSFVRFDGENRDVLLRTLAPQSERNNLILSQGDKMWVCTRKTSRPIPISMQQRLLGDASVGDILNVDLRRRYKGTVASSKGRLLLTLEATGANSLYDRVKLLVEEGSCRPIRAEFLTRNGKSLKVLKYTGFVRTSGRELVSNLEIQDQVQTSRTTQVKFSSFQATQVPDANFDRNNLRNLRFED